MKNISFLYVCFILALIFIAWFWRVEFEAALIKVGRWFTTTFPALAGPLTYLNVNQPTQPSDSTQLTTFSLN